MPHPHPACTATLEHMSGPWDLPTHPLEGRLLLGRRWRGGGAGLGAGLRRGRAGVILAGCRRVVAISSTSGSGGMVGGTRLCRGSSGTCSSWRAQEERTGAQCSAVAPLPHHRRRRRLGGAAGGVVAGGGPALRGVLRPLASHRCRCLAGRRGGPLLERCAPAAPRPCCSGAPRFTCRASKTAYNAPRRPN